MSTANHDDLTCNYCSKRISESDQTCSNCGYPVKGEPEEQRKFISLKGRMKYELKELKTAVENAQITFYVLSGLFFIMGAVFYLTLKDKNTALNMLIENLILCTIFLALGGWVKNKPVICILLGLLIYVISQIIGVIGNYSSPFSGLIIKIFIIIILIKGLLSALEAEKIKKGHNIS